MIERAEFCLWLALNFGCNMCIFFLFLTFQPCIQNTYLLLISSSIEEQFVSKLQERSFIQTIICRTPSNGGGRLPLSPVPIINGTLDVRFFQVHAGSRGQDAGLLPCVGDIVKSSPYSYFEFLFVVPNSLFCNNFCGLNSFYFYTLLIWVEAQLPLKDTNVIHLHLSYFSFL